MSNRRRGFESIAEKWTHVSRLEVFDFSELFFSSCLRCCQELVSLSFVEAE